MASKRFTRLLLPLLWLAGLPVFGQQQPAVAFEFKPKIDSVVNHYYTTQNSLWYFARLYQKVSKGVDLYYKTGKFEDGDYVKRIENTFGYYFISALDSFSQQKPTAKCWQKAFDTNSCRRYGFTQALLLSINAHINSDLYFGLQEVFAQQLPEEKHYRDFDRVSTIHENVAFAFMQNLIKSIDISRVEKAVLLKGLAKSKKELRRLRLKTWRLAEKGAKSSRKHHRYAKRATRKAVRMAKKIVKPKGLIKAGLSITTYTKGCSFYQKCELLDK